MRNNGLSKGKQPHRSTFSPEELLERHGLTSPILDLIGALVVILDRHGRIVRFNKSCQETTGYTIDEVKGKFVWDVFLLPEEKDHVRQVLLNLISTKRRSQNDNYLLTKDGERRRIAWSDNVLVDEGGQVEFLIGTGTDVTELEKTGTALQKSESKNRALLDAIPDLIFHVDRDGLFLDFNAPRHTGHLVSPDQFLGKKVNEVLPNELARETMFALEKTLASHETQVFEYNISQNGEQRSFESRLVACDVDEVLAIVREITDRKRTELALSRRDAIFEAVSFAAERFLKGLSWEANIEPVLECLGRSAEVGRVYIFENHLDRNGQMLTSQRFEWVAPGITPQIDAPELQGASYQDPAIQRMYTTLRSGEVFYGDVKDFSEAERQLLSSQDIRSIVLVPIYIGDEWWGFLGLDECLREREWSLWERDALRAAAHTLGAALQRARSDKIHAATIQISETVHSAQNPEELYERLHDIVGELMPAGNFYIALYDHHTEMLGFPYFIDEYDDNSDPKPLGKGLTEYVLRSGEPLLASPDVFDQLIRSGEVELVGAPSIDWLGVPLKTKGQTFGVLVVQSYSEGIRFSDRDKDILMFVSTQVAMAIERKQAEEALRDSEERYRSLVENIPIGVYRVTSGAHGMFVMANEAYLSMFGYDSLEELKQVSVADMYIDPRQRKSFSEMVLATGSVTGVELLLKRKDGTPLWGSVTARVDRGENGGREPFFDCVLADITKSKLREREREAIISVSSSLRSAHTRADMPPIILENLSNLLNLQGCALVVNDPGGGDLLVELAHGDWAASTGNRLLSSGTVSGQIIASGLPFLSNGAETDRRDEDLQVFGSLSSLASVPLTAQEQTTGVLWVGRAEPITEDELRLLFAIGDMAANALNRATLHEQTERRVQRLAALRSIDLAISASLDLRVVLNVLLSQLTAQLNVDAAAVLLYNSNTQTFEFSAGRGFRTNSINRARIRLGEGLAGRSAFEHRLTNISNLPENGREFIQERMLAGESFSTYYAAPLNAKGQLKGILEIFHRSPLTPDLEWLDFLETLAGQAAIAIDNATLFNDLQRSNVELALAYDTTLEGWVHALDMRDRETEGHTRRVTDMTIRLARALGKSENDLVHIRRGALLHDIGKMAIPDAILHKTGPLSEEEWVIMRKHPIYAFELLSPISYLYPALDIPYCHHEKWDGSGYPRGLKGDQIPLEARIFAVVDVWDALSSNRPYRQAWPQEKVIEYLREQSGKHFEPAIVESFLELGLTEEHFEAEFLR